MLTFSEIVRKTRLLAVGFQSKYNLKPKDNVAIILPNMLEYPIVVLAVQLCGAAANLINPAQTLGIAL